VAFIKEHPSQGGFLEQLLRKFGDEVNTVASDAAWSFTHPLDRMTGKGRAADQGMEFPFAGMSRLGALQSARGATLYHGSPEGFNPASLRGSKQELVHHTGAWREGIGVYLTPDLRKAIKYAKGKTAKGSRKVNARVGGKVSKVRLTPNARVLNLEAMSEKTWQNIAERMTGGALDRAGWNELRSLRGKEMRGASKGVKNLATLRAYVDEFYEWGGMEAFYAVDEHLAEIADVTRHLEGGVPVYVVKNSRAIGR